MSRAPRVSRAELEVLCYIQDHPAITARDVAEYFAVEHGKAKNTVLTLMERLRQKGHLVREEQEGLFRYSSTTPKADAQRAMVQEFVQTVLGGSISPFTAYLSGKSRVSAQELQELKRLVAELEEIEAAQEEHG